MNHEKPSFDEATEKGEIVSKDGYHQPGGRRGCNACQLTTDKGAYRDVSVSLPGMTVHFYHQSPVVVESESGYRLDNCGYKTSTTKERINRYIPAGFRVVQRDFDWYVETPEGEVEFSNGMVING